MLGTTTYDVRDLPYNIPKQESSFLSEDEQFSIIDRALNGDLQGIIPVTEKDMELYNRRKNGESYANEFRKATEFSYVPRHKQEQVKQERATAMGLQTPPPSTNYGGNPVLNGYQSFSNPYTQTPQYQSFNNYNYPNTYYNTGYSNYYGGMYNNYYGGYNPYYNNTVDVGDPVLNYAISSAMQNSYMQNYYGYYNYGYYQPRQQQFTINPNQRPSPIITEYANNIPQNLHQQLMVQTQEDYKYPEGFDSPVVISMSPEVKQHVMARSYYNQPPYARTEQYRNFIAQKNKEQQDTMNAINRIILGEENYERIMNERKELADRLAAEDYKRRRAYDGIFDDSSMTPAQKKLKADEIKNMQIVMSNFQYNPYNISFNLADGWNRIQAKINADKNVQRFNEFFNPNRSAIEFINEDYPRYKQQKNFEEFCRNARMESLQYDADKYRNALMRSGISSTPYLGFRQAYDPVTNSNVNVSSAPQSIAERYNERRNSYIREAEKRGGVI